VVKAFQEIGIVELNYAQAETDLQSAFEELEADQQTLIESSIERQKTANSKVIQRLDSVYEKICAIHRKETRIIDLHNRLKKLMFTHKGAAALFKELMKPLSGLTVSLLIWLLAYNYVAISFAGSTFIFAPYLILGTALQIYTIYSFKVSARAAWDAGKNATIADKANPTWKDRLWDRRTLALLHCFLFILLVIATAKYSVFAIAYAHYSSAGKKVEVDEDEYIPGHEQTGHEQTGREPAGRQQDKDGFREGSTN